MERLKPLIFILIALLIPCFCQASPYYGATFSFIEYSKEPPLLHGCQFFLNYDPNRFKWRQFNLYFDGGVAQYWLANQRYYTNTSITIYSLSPIVRYSFKKRGPFTPFLELSVGLAYLNHTRFADRDFGMHPSFQDRFGLGFSVGEREQFSIGAHIVHYSNAHLAYYNSGITIPFVIDIGYRFSP